MKVIQYKFNHGVGIKRTATQFGIITGMSLPAISLSNWIADNSMQLCQLFPEDPVYTKINIPLTNYQTAAEFAEAIRRVLPSFIQLESTGSLFRWKNVGPVPIQLEFSNGGALGTMLLREPNLVVETVSEPFAISPSLNAMRLQIDSLNIRVPYKHVPENDPNKRVYYSLPDIKRDLPPLISLELCVEDQFFWMLYRGEGTIDFYIKDSKNSH